MRPSRVWSGRENFQLILQTNVVFLAFLWLDSISVAGEETIRSTTKDNQVPTLLLNSETDASPKSFSCWTCNSTDENDACFNLTEEYRKDERVRQCLPHEHYCKVERVWYVFGVNKSTHNFSIQRNCASHCESYCLIMGDRTKLYSCATCCQDSLCNVGSTGFLSLPNAQFHQAVIAILMFTILMSLPWKN